MDSDEKGFEEAGRPHYLGHRKRLRKRFREGGAEPLPVYELLELILFQAMPRRDTKPLAKAILSRFGTFAEAVNAPEDLLLEVPRPGQAAVIEIKLGACGRTPLDARRGPGAPGAIVVAGRARLMPRSHGLRSQGAVSNFVPG